MQYRQYEGMLKRGNEIEVKNFPGPRFENDRAMMPSKRQNLQMDNNVWQAFENLPMYCYMVTPDNRILKINKSALKALGYAKQELIGKPFSLVYEDASKTRTGHLLQLRKQAKRIGNKEMEIVSKNGEKRFVLVHWNKNFHMDGTLQYSIVVQQDITQSKKAEERIQQVLKEQDVRIKEIHHRIKNNLAMVSSLLSLDSDRVENQEAREKLQDSKNRILSMVRLHELLYLSQDLASVDFRHFIQKTLNELLYVYGVDLDRIHLNLQIEDIALKMDFAIPCALIVNELVSNAIKYAFPKSYLSKPEIKVVFRHIAKNRLVLVVEDNGVGIPANIDYKNSESMGLKLIHLLIHAQLVGTIRLDRGKGTKFTLRFNGDYSHSQK